MQCNSMQNLQVGRFGGEQELIDEQEKSHHRWDKAPHSGVPHLIMMIYPAFILQATF